MIDAIVKNEQAKVNALDTWGELEWQLAGEITAWILTQPMKFPSMAIACQAFWNERLNQ